MATSAGWSTVEDLSALWGLTNPTDADKDNLVAIADGVTAAFEQYVGRAFLNDGEEVVEFFDGGVALDSPAQTPVDSISEVRVALNALRKWDDSDSRLLTEEEYNLSEDGKKLHYLRCLTKGEGNVRVAYSGGFETMPADVMRVWLAQVHSEWQRRKTPNIGSISVVGSNISVETPYGLMTESKRVLAAYKVTSPLW